MSVIYVGGKVVFRCNLCGKMYRMFSSVVGHFRCRHGINFVRTNCASSSLPYLCNLYFDEDMRFMFICPFCGLKLKYSKASFYAHLLMAHRVSIRSLKRRLY